MRRVIPNLLAIAGLVAAVVAGAAAYRTLNTGAATAPEIEGFLWPNPKQLSEFELRDQHDQPFDLARVSGHWSLWYFGYTHCPDVCPTTLSVLREVERELAAALEQNEVQFIFVSVDPARDTQAHLADYVAFFSPSFIGATAAEQQLKTLTSQLGVLYMLGEADDKGSYLVDHTSAILLTDPQGRLVGLFRAPQEAKEVAARVLAIRRAVLDAG